MWGNCDSHEYYLPLGFFEVGLSDELHDEMESHFLVFFRLLEEDHHEGGGGQPGAEDKHSRGSPISFHPSIFNFKERYVI